MFSTFCKLFFVAFYRVFRCFPNFSICFCGSYGKLPKIAVTRFLALRVYRYIPAGFRCSWGVLAALRGSRRFPCFGAGFLRSWGPRSRGRWSRSRITSAAWARRPGSRRPWVPSSLGPVVAGGGGGAGAEFRQRSRRGLGPDLRQAERKKLVTVPASRLGLLGRIISGNGPGIVAGGVSSWGPGAELGRGCSWCRWLRSPAGVATVAAAPGLLGSWAPGGVVAWWRIMDAELGRSCGGVACWGPPWGCPVAGPGVVAFWDMLCLL